MKKNYNQNKSNFKKAESVVIGYFYVNQTKSGRDSIRVALADGTTLFLNYSKDADDKGIVSLGNGGKAFELPAHEVSVKIAVREKAEAKPASKGKAAAEADEEDLF